MKRILSILLVFVLIFSVVACSKPAEKQVEKKVEKKVEEKKETSAYPVTVKNYDESDLVIKKEPKRIASIVLGTDELLLGLVDKSRIVGISGQKGTSKSVSLAAKNADKFEKMDFNIEQVLKVKPDLVIGPSWKKELASKIKEAKINYYGYKTPNTIEGQKKVIMDFATVLGEKKKGEAIIADWNKRIDAIKVKAKTIKEEDKVTVLPYNMHGSTSAKGKIVDEIIYLVGAKNAATEIGLEKSAKINKEKIIEINPDVILMTAWGKDDLKEFNKYVEDFKNDPSLKDVKAVKNNRIIVEDGRYMTIVTQHLIDGIEFVAKNVYPKVYGK